MANEADELSDSLSELQRRFAQLPDVEEPPQTTFQVINRSSREVYWNRMLSYLLDPTEPHGFDTELLEQFLLVLKKNPKLDFVFDRRHFEEIEVESEVTTPEGNVPDILIRSGREWFICIEMKVGAIEGENQTERYTNDEYVGNISKEEFPKEGRHYVYLAEKDAADANADEFVNIVWSEVVAELERFQVQSQGQYPAKSLAQLDDFLDTIRREMNMTNSAFEENQLEKMRLYLEFPHEIDRAWEAREAFDGIHEHEVDSWQERLCSDFKPSSWNNKWSCDNREYGQIYRETWRRTNGLKPTDEHKKAPYRVAFRHAIDNRELFKNGELLFKLYTLPPQGQAKRNYSEASDRFRKTFTDRFHSSKTVDKLSPFLQQYDIQRIEVGQKNHLKKTYEFEPKELPDSYYETLQTAFEEHQEIADHITRVFEATLDEIE